MINFEIVAILSYSLDVSPIGVVSIAVGLQFLRVALNSPAPQGMQAQALRYPDEVF